MEKKQLEKKIRTFLIASALVSILLLFVNGVVLSVLSSEGKQLTKAKKARAELSAERTGVNETTMLLLTYEEHIPEFSRAIPDQEQFVSFVNALETVANVYGTEHAVRFTSSVPVKDKNNLFIPFTLTLKTTFSQYLAFLNRFERMPYIMTITSSEIKARTDTVEVVVQAKVYVQNPFTH